MGFQLPLRKLRGRRGDCITNLTVESNDAAFLVYSEGSQEKGRYPIVGGKLQGQVQLNQYVFSNVTIVDQNGSPLPSNTRVTVDYGMYKRA